MKAYLVLAHNNSRQLHRLLLRLNDAGTRFFLHIDKKSPIGDFKFIFDDPALHITPVERERGKWGGLGIVKATLNGLRQICSDEISYDHIHLVSGADYPIVSNATIDDFFLSNTGKNFIEFFPMPAAKWHHHGMRRLEWYNFIRMQYYNRVKWYTLLVANKVINFFPFFRRRFPSYLKPYGGSQWWSITVPAARYIIDFVDAHPDYIRYHRHTLLPDECFFQTILLNAKEPWIQESLVNDNLRYIVWEKPGATAFPLLLTMEEYSNIQQSGKLWARKFDMNKDPAVLDALDKSSMPVAAGSVNRKS
jgi:hypothetical protein